VGDGELVLNGFVDSDCIGDAGDQKSTLGCCFGLGSSMISWFSRKKITIALNLVETEYVVASLGSCESNNIQQ